VTKNICARKLLAALLIGSATPGLAAEPEPMPLDKAAAMFGAREAVAQMSLSPDGKHIAYVGAAAGQATALFVGDLVKGDVGPITFTDNKPLSLRSCHWSAADRLVCWGYGLSLVGGRRVSYTRLFAIDADGKNQKSLAAPTSENALYTSYYDGAVVDWLDQQGRALIQRNHVPEGTTGTVIAKTGEGLGVDLVDTRKNTGRSIEQPRRNAEDFISDGQGHIRIMELAKLDSSETEMNGEKDYFYRTKADGAWVPFSTVDIDGKGTQPIAVDTDLNVAYALKPKDGRKALYRIALDGSMKEELVLEHPTVDISGAETLRGRVIGGSYVADVGKIVYFDPGLDALAKQLAKVLPQTPLINFVDASADGDTLLILAASDTDEGRFYLFQKSTHRLQPLMSVRPQADGASLPHVQPIAYKSFDGTEVPAYLTLPPGSSGKNLPAIVMPHGGPGDRDSWGFNWLAQFFANRGFAVIQPQFRGSIGFGESWFFKTAFEQWPTSIGDVNAAGHWLVAQGIADPSKLAIFGWSYGGYAALQSNVLDPDLFKAVVAVAPVADIAELRRESEGFADSTVARKYIGNGPAIAEGSPALHAGRFKAPVLMFHGTSDITVLPAQSQGMDAALHRAGKQSELVRYPDLDHQLLDSKVRADLLTKADQFLRKSMNMPVD